MYKSSFRYQFFKSLLSEKGKYFSSLD